MNFDRVREIITLTAELVEASTGTDLLKETTSAAILLDLIRKGIQAYQEHSGQPLDPSLVKVEAPL